MLDNSIINQLRDLFKNLNQQFVLEVAKSSHDKQNDLIDMAQKIASVSKKIQIFFSQEESHLPKLSITINDKKTGINFLGVPGGHEFSNLILAILNGDGKGKIPDETILKKVRSLKGPISLRTFVSLDCHNCPEIVWGLNLMALQRDDFSHTMIDGELFQSEVNRLGLQGVPCVLNEDKIISVGKSSLTDLLVKLEEEFGVEESSRDKNINLGLFDVVIIGAGPAGASAAIYSARKGLKTAIVADRVGGQVKDTKEIENFIGVKSTQGVELASKLLDHIHQYDISLFEHRRVISIDNKNPIKIHFETGENLDSKAVIIATGAKWRELGVPGEKEYLGKGVAFCPHCDGPYFKGKDVVVIGGGNSGVEAALDLAGIVKSITLIEFDSKLKADQFLVNKLTKLRNANIITNARTHQILGDGNKVRELQYEDRTSGKINTLNTDGIFIQIGLRPNSSFLRNVVEMNASGEILVDNKCRTSSAGIYGAGDVTNIPYKQIVIAIGEGAKAGLAAYEDIILNKD